MTDYDSLTRRDPPASPPGAWRWVARRDVNGANLSAGLTAILFYAFGAIPVYLGVVDTLGLGPAVASSWFTIIFLTSTLTSIPLTLYFRQPLAIGWTIPGLVLIGAVGGQFSLAEIAGANLVCGAAIVLIAATGIADRLMAWVPLPLILGMFAGSVLAYETAVFRYLGEQPLVVGAALLGYLVAKVLRRSWLPPVAGATALGVAGAVIGGKISPAAFEWTAPELVLIRPEWSVASWLSISLPLMVLAIGAGSVQGLGLLASQGYRPPIKLVTLVIGVASMVNAVFGGHAATLQRTGTAIVAGEEAGPVGGRYVASLVAAFGGLLLAAGSAAAATLLGVLPAGLIVTLAGLAILTTVLDAMRQAVGSAIPLGAFFAFAIAASPLTVFGIGPTFWALIGGLLVSALVERKSLRSEMPRPGRERRESTP